MGLLQHRHINLVNAKVFMRRVLLVLPASGVRHVVHLVFDYVFSAALNRRIVTKHGIE